MRYQVRMTAKALRDAEDTLRWFDERHSSAAGTRWLAQLMAKIDALEIHPDRCGLAAEAEEVGVELRQLLFGKRRGVYRILFIIRGRTVEIVRIRHSARDALSSDDL